MALIIKGDMPKDCFCCDELISTTLCPISLQEPFFCCNGERPSDCPVIGEIPDNHGRLVDADELKKELLEHGHPDTREWYYAEVDQFIDECPTVVGASK